MTKYRKKPVVIEAELYKPGMEDGFKCSCYNKCPYHSILNGKPVFPCKKCNYGTPYIETLEGKHYISPGDYIITGVKGERYPCKPDIFAMTYEAVEEGDNNE